MSSPLSSLPESSGSEDNWNGETEDSFIGSSLWRFRRYGRFVVEYSPLIIRTFDSQPFVPSSVPITPNLLEVNLPWTTSGRMTLPSSEPDSNSEIGWSDATTNEIGSLFGNVPSPVTSWALTLHSESSTTEDSNRSPPTTWCQSRSNGVSSCSGEIREQASLDELGLRLDWTPTPKTRGRSFGAGMADKTMSSSMNSAEELISPTSSDGSTAIQLPSRRRVRPQYLGPVGSGSPPISLPNSGFRDLTQGLMRRYCDGLQSHISRGR